MKEALYRLRAIGRTQSLKGVTLSIERSGFHLDHDAGVCVGGRYLVRVEAEVEHDLEARKDEAHEIGDHDEHVADREGLDDPEYVVGRAHGVQVHGNAGGRLGLQHGADFDQWRAVEDHARGHANIAQHQPRVVVGLVAHAMPSQHCVQRQRQDGDRSDRADARHIGMIFRDPGEGRDEDQRHDLADERRDRQREDVATKESVQHPVVATSGLLGVNPHPSQKKMALPQMRVAKHGMNCVAPMLLAL